MVIRVGSGSLGLARLGSLGFARARPSLLGFARVRSALVGFMITIPDMHARPVIAQLAEHLTVEVCRCQMVPGSIPGDRIYDCRCGDGGGGGFV